MALRLLFGTKLPTRGLSTLRLALVSSRSLLITSSSSRALAVVPQTPGTSAPTRTLTNASNERLATVVHEAIEQSSESLGVFDLPKLGDDEGWRTHASFDGDVGTNALIQVWSHRRWPPGLLAFVGDKYLDLAISLELIRRFPRLKAGCQTILLSSLVSNDTLSHFSRHLGLPARLRATSAQLEMLQANRTVQASLFEAYLGQLGKEKGFESVVEVVKRLYDTSGALDAVQRVLEERQPHM